MILPGNQERSSHRVQSSSLNLLTTTLFITNQYIFIEVAVIQYLVCWLIRRKARVRALGQTSKQNTESISSVIYSQYTIEQAMICCICKKVRLKTLVHLTFPFRISRPKTITNNREQHKEGETQLDWTRATIEWILLLTLLVAVRPIMFAYRFPDFTQYCSADGVPSSFFMTLYIGILCVLIHRRLLVIVFASIFKAEKSNNGLLRF